MLNYWKKGVMKMTNEQELFVLIIIFAVTFRYLYKNRIIYQKELIKQEERERKQRKRRYGTSLRKEKCVRMDRSN